MADNNGDGVEVSGSSSKLPERTLVHRASVKSYVEQLKSFHLTFQDLSVYVPEEIGCCNGCSTWIKRPVSNWLSQNYGWAVERKDAYYALNETSGYVKSGEMVLVLTPDTQYSSALIQTLTGRLSDKYSICGSVRVNGKTIPTGNLQGWRRIASHVSADDNTHAPILTVRETLRFAAECTRNETVTTQDIDDVVDEVLEILDLTNVSNTVVGDENVRGVSGGQKRRVTIGEMLIGYGTRFIGFENVTDGLSSQDSYNIIKQLKNACMSFRSAAVISLNQPSDEIVELFDNILVLNGKGEMVYFGPPTNQNELRSIFLGSTAGDEDTDVGSICDLCLNRMTDSDDVVDAIKGRFEESDLYKNLHEQLLSLNKSPNLIDVTDMLPKEKYASGLRHNFKILGKRKYMLIVRNPTTFIRLFVAVFFGVVVGSLFSVLKQDVPSSLARSAFLFQNLFLVLLLSTGVTVPQNIRERITYYKHRSAEFYSSRIYYICQILYELPLSILEAILIAVTSYFWVDLNPKAERFFFYIGVMIAMEFCGLALGRFFCAISRTQVVAKSVVSVATLLFSTVSGFMPKYRQIPAIFRWASWISPTGYGFEALAINEYVGRELVGITLSRGNDLNTEVGTVSGESWLETLQLPRESWSDSLQTIKIFNLFFLFFMAFVIDLLGMTLMERSRKNFFSQLRRSQRTSTSLTFVSDNASGTAPDPPEWPKNLAVTNLCYLVPLKREAAPVRFSVDSIFGPLLLGNKKGKQEMAKTKDRSELQLLDNVSAIFHAGRATALMGTSGAGKTTLLDVIAGYKTGGRITGDMTLSGVPKDKKIWQLLSGYAEQNDILNPFLTVLETLKFTASCRLPASMNREAIINKILDLIKLEDWVDVVVGSEKDGEGIPKHVRKRLTIAVQLVMLPKILFLDEPTTGLGTAAANLVMTAIRRSTTELNLITVATIHQPSKFIWDFFDDLLLLTRGGKVAYMGEMGQNSKQVTDYFASISGISMAKNMNPADYVISAVSAVDPNEAQTLFRKSKVHEALMDKLRNETELPQEEREAAITMMANTKKETASRKSFLRELRILTRRMIVTQWRNPAYSVTRIICSTLLSIYFGILFGKDKSTIEGAVLTIGSTFFLTFVLVVPMQASVVPLVDDRAVLYREATSGLYSRWSYAIASLLADIPFHVLNCLLMFCGFYFIVGFQLEGDRPAYFIVMVFFINWAFTSIGEVYAVMTPNEEAANGLAGLTTILSVLFMGFLIKLDDMPSYWQWANWADLLRYVIQGLTSNELGDNRYLLFDPDNIGGAGGSPNATIFGDLGSNATHMFLVPPGTDISPGSDASQASVILNLLFAASPSLNDGWNSSIAGTLTAFFACGIKNECFVKPVATNFLRCFVVGFPRAPCKDEFTALGDAYENGRDNIQECLVEGLGNIISIPGNPTLIPRTSGNEITVTEDDVVSLLDNDRRDLVLCLLDAILPAGALDEIKELITRIIKIISGISIIAEPILNIIRYGLPGEVILFVFGWAELQDGELVAPYKWWYCLYAVSMFIVGLEVFKILGTRFVIWTKR